MFGISFAVGVALLMFWPDWAIELPALPQVAEE
jgi:hypothetical protein